MKMHRNLQYKYIKQKPLKMKILSWYCIAGGSGLRPNETIYMFERMWSTRQKYLYDCANQ